MKQNWIKEYNHGDHMAEIGKMNSYYEIIIAIQKKIEKQKIILDKFDERKKEQESNNGSS